MTALSAPESLNQARAAVTLARQRRKSENARRCTAARWWHLRERGNGMRHWAGLMAVLWAAGCSSAPGGTATLTLNDPYWERVNVQIVITKRADCDSREDGYIETRELVMLKQRSETIDVPPDATVCWRHDRNPNKPVTGVWSGWTRATLQPGGSAQTEL